MDWLLRIGGTLLFLGLLVWLDLTGKLPVADIFATLGRANPLLVGLSVVLYVPFLLVKTARWRRLAAEMRMPLGGRDAWRIYAIGLAAGTFTPGQAGDMLKAWYLQRSGYPLGRALGSSILDRLFDLAALAVLGLLGVAVYGGRFAGQAPALIVLTLACLAAVVFFSVSRTRRWAVNLVTRRLLRVVDRNTVSSESPTAGEPPSSIVHRPSSGARPPTPASWSLRSETLIGAGLLTVASFAVSVFRVWLLAAAIGIVMGPLEVSGFAGLTTAAALVPVTVGGLGTRDLMASAALAQFGRPPAEAVALSSLILLLNLAQAIIGWIVWLRYAPDTSNQGQ